MKTILFGNGLNYMSENHISWKQLLDKIKGDNLFENGKLPNTMIYERSIIGNPISFDTLTQKEEAIKKDIAELLYRPDFYLKEYDIYLEHFGVDEHDRAKWLGSFNEQKYVDEMLLKRETHKTHDTKLLETYSYYNRDNILLQKLQEMLEAEYYRYIEKLS